MIEIPETYNELVEESLLEVLAGRNINTDILLQILRDCISRNMPGDSKFIQNLLIQEPRIFFGLAGLDLATAENMQRAIACPSEYGIEKTCDSPLVKIFNAENLNKIASYHIIRDNLNYVQVSQGISGVISKHIAIRDRLLSYQDYDSQLKMLPSDREILKEQVNKISSFFNNISSDCYVLFHENDNGDLVSLDKEKYSDAISCAEYAWLHEESYEWTKVDDGSIGKLVNKLEPDEITLELCQWNDNNGEYDYFFKVIAYHKNTLI